MSRSDWSQRLPIVVGLAIVYAVMLSRFDLRLLFTDTILTGGDSASWLQPLVALRDEFLPRLRFFGYSHSNFFGYLEGQHYFILPFLPAALLSYVIPVTIALKLVTVAGTFALPLTMYCAVRSLVGSRWLGLAAAALSLLFLFNESYSMFGGNFLSTFAGEFCYSWAIAILPLFVAAAWQDHAGQRWSPRSGLLLGLIGLCHIFVFMVAFFLPFFFAFRREHLVGERAAGSVRRYARAFGQKLRTGDVASGHHIHAGVAELQNHSVVTGNQAHAVSDILQDHSGLVELKAHAGSADPRTLSVSQSCHPGAAVLRIPLTYLIGLSLMAFWFLPMVATRTWAQSISMIWYFASFQDFAGQTLLPVWASAVLMALAVIVLPRSKTAPVRSPVARLAQNPVRPGRRSGWQSDLSSPRRCGAYLLYGLGACAFMFMAATVLEVPDIRFVPPALILSICCACLFVRDGFPPRLQPWMAGLILLVACSLSLRLARNSPAWFTWNYSGYQAKSQWQNLSALAEHYRGGIMDGRILWEKQNQNDNHDFGSERGFENLYWFTGRPSAEGIHYGSSFMARATTYLQSTYSLNPVDPEAQRLYSRVDPQSWPLRFTQANASHIIIHSPELKQAFDGHPDFSLDQHFGKFAVYAYRHFNASYVEILDDTALSIVNDSPGGFKTDFYRFYRDYALIRRPFVPASFADDALAVRVGTLHPEYDSLHASLHASLAADGSLAADASLAADGSLAADASLAADGSLAADASLAADGSWRGYHLQPTRVAVQHEAVDGFNISFETALPGAPHVIKSAYAPGWRSAGGERIYPIAPGFMLIHPTSSTVRLEYRRTTAEWVGLAITGLVLPLLLLGFGARRIQTLRCAAYRPLFAVAFAIFFGAMIFFVVRAAYGTARVQGAIQQAQTLDLRGKHARDQALALVEPYASMDYLERYDNLLIFEAYRIKAQALALSGQPDAATELYKLLRMRYAHVRDLDRLPR
jgi:hypothetical protein